MVNVIPSYASIDEMGLHVALEAERDFNTIMQEAGIAELRAIEEGTVITEAEEAKKTKSIVERFKGWLNKIWEFIKGLYDKLLGFVKKQTEKVSEFLSKMAAKNKEKLLERAKKLKDTTKDGGKKEFGKAHAWTGFADVVANNSGKVWEAVRVYDDFEKNIPGFMDKHGKKKVDRGSSLANYSGMFDFKEMSNALESKVKMHLQVNNLNSESIQKRVKEIIAGEEFTADKEYIIHNWDDIFKYGTDFGKTANDVKKQLNEIKKRFDSTTRDIEGFAKKIQQDTNTASTLNAVVTNMKKGKIVLTAICNATVATVKARCSEASGFVLRVATAAKKKEESDKEKAVGESVVPSSFQTELASLFDF